MRDVLARFVVGLGLLSAGCEAPPASTLGGGSAPIVGGTPTTGSPATVSVGGFCSGTLISPKVVLTAAHCLQGTPLADAKIFFGSDVNGAGMWIDAAHLETHPSTDIGAITMVSAGPATPVPAFGGAAGTLDTQIGTAVQIVGFGVTSENGNDYGLKRQGMTSLTGVSGDEMITSPSPQGTCYGDSGGPNYMTVGGKEYVIGVTSYGTAACGAGEDRSIRTDSNIAWIDAYVAAHDTGTPPPDPCAADGACNAACPSHPTGDPDCCLTDGACQDGCGDADMDCQAEPPPPAPDAGPGGGGNEEEDGEVVGNCGCVVGGRGQSPAGALAGLALGLAALVLARRRRR